MWNQGTPSLRQSNSFVDIMGFICAKNWTQDYFQPSHGHYGIVERKANLPIGSSAGTSKATAAGF